MRYALTIVVSLKPGHSDPEGETTANLLQELGYRVQHVGVGKIYNIVVEGDSKKQVLNSAEEMCKRLLANPTKDNYKISIEEQ